MKKLSLFKKISLFLKYRKVLKIYEDDLLNRFNIRIDNVCRIYTVLNIPQDIIEEPYNLRKSDIDAIAQKYIKEYSLELSKYLDSKGLKEMYSYYDVDKVDKYSFLLIFGFSLFKTHIIMNKIITRFLPFLIISSIILYFIFR